MSNISSLSLKKSDTSSPSSTPSRTRKEYDKRDTAIIKCKGRCGLELEAQRFRIYYYKPKGSDVKEKKRLDICKECSKPRKLRSIEKYIDNTIGNDFRL